MFLLKVRCSFSPVTIKNEIETVEYRLTSTVLSLFNGSAPLFFYSSALKRTSKVRKVFLCVYSLSIALYCFCKVFFVGMSVGEKFVLVLRLVFAFFRSMHTLAAC